WSSDVCSSDLGDFFLCDGKPESVTAERTDVHRVLQRVGAGGGLQPDGRIDQPSFVIDAEDPETAEVIRDDQIRLVSGSDCAEFLQAVAAGGIYRRHFYGGHGRKTQLDCSSYIIVNVSLTENVLNVFVVRTEGKVLAGQIV